MTNTKTKMFEVHPSSPIPGVLPNMQRITKPMQLELDEDSFKRCMSMGIVYAVVGEERVLIREDNYEGALKVFDRIVEFKTKEINLSSLIGIHDRIEIN